LLSNVATPKAHKGFNFVKFSFYSLTSIYRLSSHEPSDGFHECAVSTRDENCVTVLDYFQDLFGLTFALGPDDTDFYTGQVKQRRTVRLEPHATLSSASSGIQNDCHVIRNLKMILVYSVSA
jgi:hypothetical protein